MKSADPMRAVLMSLPEHPDRPLLIKLDSSFYNFSNALIRELRERGFAAISSSLGRITPRVNGFNSGVVLHIQVGNSGGQIQVADLCRMKLLTGASSRESKLIKTIRPPGSNRSRADGSRRSIFEISSLITDRMLRKTLDRVLFIHCPGHTLRTMSANCRVV